MRLLPLILAAATATCPAKDDPLAPLPPDTQAPPPTRAYVPPPAPRPRPRPAPPPQQEEELIPAPVLVQMDRVKGEGVVIARLRGAFWPAHARQHLAVFQIAHEECGGSGGGVTYEEMADNGLTYTWLFQCYWAQKKEKR